MKPVQPTIHEWVKELYDKNYPLLTFYAYRLTGDLAGAEDIAGEAFIYLLTSSENVTTKDHCRHTLYRIVKNRCIDHLRRSGKQKEVLEKYVQTIELTVVQEFEAIDYRHKIMHELPATLQEVFRLRYEQDCSAKEISTTLDISLDNAKKRCSRMVDKVRALIPKQQQSLTKNQL